MLVANGYINTTFEGENFHGFHCDHKNVIFSLVYPCRPFSCSYKANCLLSSVSIYNLAIHMYV